MASSEEKSHRVETFDGSDPSLYRRWKRRAQLMLASLPTNVPEAKYGPRLMEFIKGEAEALLESIPVEELTKSGGTRRSGKRWMTSMDHNHVISCNRP